MHKKRIRKTIAGMIMILLCLLCACSGPQENSNKENNGNTDTVEVTSVPEPAKTDEVNIEPTDTPAVPSPVITGSAETGQEEIDPVVTAPVVTVSVTPAPDIAYGSPENLAKNRELHSRLKGFSEYSELGTGRELNDKIELNIKYGIDRLNPNIIAEVADETGKVVNRHICGLKDKEVEKKINDRIDEIFNIFNDPEYYTDVAGIIPFLKEHGSGERKINIYEEYNANHLISFVISLQTEWIWDEKIKSEEIPDYDGDGNIRVNDFQEYLSGLRQDLTKSKGGIVYNSFKSFDPLGYYPDDDTFRYRICAYTYEEKGLTFNLETGEELRLSDFFKEGEDYLKILSDENYVQSIRYSFGANDDGDYAEYRKWVSNGDWYGNYDEYREYDGGSIYKGVTPDTEYWLTNVSYPSICLLSKDNDNCAYICTELPLYNMVRFTDIFEEKESFVIAELTQYVRDYDYKYYDNDEEMDVDEVYKTFAEFDVIGLEGDKVSVKLRKPALEKEIDFSDYDERLINLITLPDEEYEKLLKEYLEKTGFMLHNYECSLTNPGILEYPNGYDLIYWYGENKTGIINEYAEEEYWEIVFYQWMKDGKMTTPEEMIDISTEELLKLLFSSMRSDESRGVLPGKDEKLSDEELERTVKILSSHVVSFDPTDSFYPVFDFVDFKRQSMYMPELTIYPGMISEEELEELPESVLYAITGFRRYSYFSDGTLGEYLKHFKVYEGYKF